MGRACRGAAAMNGPAPGTFCAAVREAGCDPLLVTYHDTEYGAPSADDTVLFERLVLEINQAGLSWLTVLRKRAAMRTAYAGFDLDRVAGFDDADRARLLADAGIIRNRRKIDAAIENARRLRGFRDRHGSIAAWLDVQGALDKPAWVRLFRQHLVFTGPEIVGEFLMSLGRLPGAHDAGCTIRPGR